MGRLGLIVVNVSILLISPLITLGQGDLSALFPEVAGCTKTVMPLQRGATWFRQDAVYKSSANAAQPSSLGRLCGIVSIISSPGILRSRESWKGRGSFGRTTIKGYPAWRGRDWCGVPGPQKSSIDVYFSGNAQLRILFVDSAPPQMAKTVEVFSYKFAQQLIADMESAGQRPLP